VSNPRQDGNQPIEGGPRRGSYRLLFISIAALFASVAVMKVASAAQDPALDPAAAAAKWSNLWTTVGIWVAALLTLGIFSFLYKDNPVYKVCESIFVGASAAYYMVNAFWTSLVPKLIAPIAPAFTKANLLPELTLPASDEAYYSGLALAIVPLTLGIMLLFRLLPKGGWISVWPLAFVIGTTAGIRLLAAIETDVLAQISAAGSSVIVYNETTDAAGVVTRTIDWAGVGKGVLSVVCVLTVLTYFFFSVEHKGAVGKTARVGIWFLMITFGASFGLTVMGRITLLSQRFEFLLKDWLGFG
jgi:hypothetical protein